MWKSAASKFFKEARTAVFQGEQIDFGNARWRAYALSDRRFKVTAIGDVYVAGVDFRQIIMQLSDPQPLSGIRIRGLNVYGDASLAGLRLSQNLYITSCIFEDNVSLSGLSGHVLDLEGSAFQKSLDLRNLSLTKNLFLRRGFVAHGPVLLRDSEIGGVVDCVGGSFLFEGDLEAAGTLKARDHAGDSFGASRLRAHSLFWYDVKLSAKTQVTLKDVTVDVLRDQNGPKCNLESWPVAGKLLLYGFTYRRKSPAPLDVDLEWIGRDTTIGHFEPNARTLLNHLRNNSTHDNYSRATLAVRRSSIANEKFSLRKLARIVQVVSLQHSFSLEIIVLGLLIVLFITFVAAQTMWNYGLFSPSAQSLALNSCFYSTQAPCVGWAWRTSGVNVRLLLPSAYPSFNAVEFSLDVIFPYAALNATTWWEPATLLGKIVMVTCKTVGFGFQAAGFWSLLGRTDPT